MNRLFFILIFVLISTLFAKAQTDWNDFRVEPEVEGFEELEVWRYNLWPTDDTTNFPFNQCYALEDSLLYLRVKYNGHGLPVYKAGFIGYHCAYRIETFKYDQFNREVENVRLDRDSSFISQCSYIYDDQEKSCRVTCIEGDAVLATRESFYSKQGMLLKSNTLHHKPKGELRLALVEYDTLQRIAIWKIDNPLGQEESYLVEKRDIKGRLKESITLESDSSFSSGEFYLYDSENRLVEMRWMVRDNSGEKRIMREKTTYEYENGALKVKTEMDSEREKSQTNYHQGLAQKRVSYYDGRERALYIYKYF